MHRPRVTRRRPLSIAWGHWYFFADWPPFLIYMDITTGECSTAVVGLNPIRVWRDARRIVRQRARDRAWEVGCDDFVTREEAREAWDRLAP